MKYLTSIILLLISIPNIVHAENLMAGMKSPTAQVLKCTQEVDGWGRKNKKLAISN